MAAALMFASKLVRLPLLDADGAPIGRIDDVVVVPPTGTDAPHVLGFVGAVQRRRIFVNAARVGELGAFGVRLHSGTIDVRHFQLRPGELLAVGNLFGRRVESETVVDVGVRQAERRARSWEVDAVALRSSGGLRRRSVRVVPWHEVAHLFDAGPVAKEVAQMREMHPSDVAQKVRALPLERRRQLAEVMEDERLADVLEELPEAEQLRIIEGLDPDRVAHVLEEMEPDDAADLLGEMSGEQRRQLLEAMEPDEADDLRRLLRYGGNTAGGLMTPEPIILPPESTVAEALARVRDPELPTALASQVFVAQPPTETPTGTYLGVVGFQRLLREPPGMEIGRCLDEPAAVEADLPEI